MIHIEFTEERELLLLALLSATPVQKLRAICDDFQIPYKDGNDVAHLREAVETYWRALFAEIARHGRATPPPRVEGESPVIARDAGQVGVSMRILRRVPDDPVPPTLRRR